MEYDELTTRIYRYNRIAVYLHWMIAFLIIVQLFAGTYMVDFIDPDDKVFQFTLYQFHKTAGLLVLSLTFMRIVWRFFNAPPPPHAHWSQFERAASHATHLGFYGLMLALPLTGWAMVSISPTQIPTFLFQQTWLPFIHLPGAGVLEADMRVWLEEAFMLSHNLLGKLTALLIVLHIGAALKHQFIDKDRILLRMMPPSGRYQPPHASGRVALLSIAAGVIFFVGGVLGGYVERGLFSDIETGTSPVLLDQKSGGWQVDHDTSSLSFVVVYSGAEVTGTFGSWNTDITFDPNDLTQTNVNVSIDMTQVQMSDAYLAEQINTADGFAPNVHPTAHFSSTTARHVGGTDYELDGLLTIKGASQDVVLPFTFEEREGIAYVVGNLTINRIDYAIGGDGEDWLKYSIDIGLDLQASAKK